MSRERIVILGLDKKIEDLFKKSSFSYFTYLFQATLNYIKKLCQKKEPKFWYMGLLSPVGYFVVSNTRWPNKHTWYDVHSYCRKILHLGSECEPVWCWGKDRNNDIKVFIYSLCRSLCLFQEENCLQKDLAE